MSSVVSKLGNAVHYVIAQGPDLQRILKCT